MMGKTTKVLALVATAGLTFGGCMPSCCCGLPNFCQVMWGVALNAVTEFVWDNDAVFDLFQDDFGTGALYDDRFTAAPTRGEPEGANVNNLGAGNQ
ncbi:MAG: hypothetical protein JXB13_18905 [Phycisphaerae bacterium]|nr:hypothetical protein [Phycisphaerae bacterium]